MKAAFTLWMCVHKSVPHIVLHTQGMIYASRDRSGIPDDYEFPACLGGFLLTDRTLEMWQQVHGAE